MRFLGFIGPSYTLQSLNVDCQRCVNLYPEMDEMGTGNEGEVASLVSTPGLKLLVTLPKSPVRGVYTDSAGQLWAVGGNILYQISDSWIALPIGPLQTSTGYVSFSDNGTELVIVDGPYGYQIHLSNGSLSQIDDPNFYGANQVTFMDQYLIFNKPGTNEFYLSGLDIVTPFPSDPPQVGSKEGCPDNIVGLLAIQENLYLFGEQSLEIWYDNGGSGSTFPFQRIQGALSQIGCAAVASIASFQNAVYWLGKDATGQGIVFRAQGLQPQRISNYGIERALSKISDLSGARAWVYQQAGHPFYCLNVPGLDTTFVYDASTDLWHERAYLVDGQYSRHLGDCAAFAYNTNVVGDYSSGNVYALDPDTLTDNSNPIVRDRIAPHISKDKNRIFHSQFNLDMEMGVGLDGSVQGSNPQVILRWSDDFCNSWSNEHWTSIGPIGARLTRAIWRRLGQARDRVYWVRITDPVKVTFLGAELDIQQGAA